MAWSSYAHLPNNEDEYWKILSKLTDGMGIEEVDSIIARTKGKEKVQHHYRSNLANIDLFHIDKGKIYLNYDVDKLEKEKTYLKEVLSECSKRRNSKEINSVKSIICRQQTYDMSVIAEELQKKDPNIEKSNFIRWTRPVVTMFKIIDILSENQDIKIFSNAEFLQDAYLKAASKYGNIAALEEIDKELKKIDHNYEIEVFIEQLLCNLDLKFKIELLMLPNWAASNKVYVINKEYYTHIKVKGDLLEVK